MNVWIITTGSSDVQLQNKERWNTLYPKVRQELEISKQFSYSETEQNGKKLWRYPARAMGVVYGKVLTEHYADLEFPLLNSFSSYLKSEKIELNRIIVLLTDQCDIVSVADKNKPSHFYWQDTCTLQPILEQYLKITFPDVVMDKERDFRMLKPEKGSSGLDDWNSVLTLVQKEFIKLDIPEDATVYVSHQAGTPAISSAVQFVSLGKFAEKVQFLVSNEYEKKALEPIKSSKYLKAIKFEQAKELLKNHDYAAVKSLLNDLDDETQILLDAAIQWNYAKFDNFANKLKKLSDEKFVEDINERTKEENWWWTAYEEAYLAVIRLKQENTVEAMFHSFRAIEGLILEWAIWKYTAQIKKSNPNQPRTLYFHNENTTMSTQLNYWFERYSNTDYSNVGLFGEALFELLKASHLPGKWHNNASIKTVAKITKNERNVTFHQLKGLEKSDLFDAWNTGDEEDWKKRLLGCLNFIAQPDLSKPFTSLEEASLMAQVHHKLTNLISSYQPE